MNHQKDYKCQYAKKYAAIHNWVCNIFGLLQYKQEQLNNRKNPMSSSNWLIRLPVESPKSSAYWFNRKNNKFEAVQIEFINLITVILIFELFM